MANSFLAQSPQLDSFWDERIEFDKMKWCRLSVWRRIYLYRRCISLTRECCAELLISALPTAVTLKRPHAGIVKGKTFLIYFICKRQRVISVSNLNYSFTLSCQRAMEVVFQRNSHRLTCSSLGKFNIDGIDCGQGTMGSLTPYSARETSNFPQPTD